MAEFKLGRIRFVWQGEWATGTAYVADDVVSFGGKSYICVKNHTASTAFNTDYDNVIPKWEVVSDGTKWRGDWEPEVEYAPGDVVKYGSLVYICETGHTSATFEAPDYLGLEENLDDWTSFATSFDWKGDWTSTTRYKINDLVRYGGYVYLCNTAHVSAATDALGLEADQGKWTLFSDGLVYLGDWVTATRYKVNDVVKYGGNVFICTTPHTSDDFLTDEGSWDVFIEGFQFEDSWSSATTYQIGDTVTYGGYVYVAKTNNSGAQPTASPLDWEVFTTGFAFQGDWVDTDSYKVGDVVRLGGTTYVAIADNTDQVPPNDTYWSKLNSGINWTNSIETFSQVTATNVSSTGSGVRFDVVKSKTVYTVTVSTGFAGTGYAVNDVVKISGANVGGLTPANDIEVTITGETGGVIDTVTHTGYSSTWKTGTEYFVGDVVIFGASSFICVTTHTSELASRPDNDANADYWNLLTLGSEAFALTTEGDMVYYGNNGPTRLPIGVDGQILRATDGAPDWANYGLIDNVVYVGPLGNNEPAPRSGLSIDKPWASVRYALEQVRDGYLNPQGKTIIKNNKQFLLKEVTAWIEYTYKVIVTETVAGTRLFSCSDTSNLRAGMPIEFSGVTVFGGVTEGTTYYVDAIVSSTEFRISETVGGVSFIPTDATGIMEGNLSYDHAICERDTGYLVDALIYDIGRGGTFKTTAAANAYYTRAGNEYINSNLGNQRYQTIDAYQFLKSLVTEVLNNEKPVSYQMLNGMAIEDRAAQIIDLNLTAEATAIAKAGDLIDIVTNGLVAESNTAIALPVLPNTTVFIKTGTYNEILPIIIPEYTAIVGDELRTSVVQPQPAIAELASDKAKTTSALNRIKDVSEQLLQNVTIEKTAGNTASQRYLNGYGGATTATQRVDQSTVTALNILENGLDVVSTMPDVGATPTSGSNNASDSGFANAVAQLEANYEFIKTEITAWIQDQIDGPIAPFTGAFTYDSEACARDVEYILDALRYDLTYGGNLETTVAARAYFVDGSPVYGAGEKEETLAAYARLKTVVGEVILETVVTNSTGNPLVQDTTGDAGSAAAQAFAEARVQEIYDTIDTDGTLPTPVLPDTSWVNTSIVTASTNINTNKTALQESVIDFINSNFGSYVYDSAKCRRDAGILQTGAAYDVALETNYNAVRNGLAYRRSMSAKVLEEQLTETIGAITEERDLVEALMSDPTATTRNTAYWTEVIDIIQNNTPDAISWSGGAGVGAKTTARTELQTNRASIISDLITWIDSTYPSATYDQTLCERDTGYIVDAISYDVQYGGNSATIDAATAYFEGYIEILPVAQRSRTAAAIAQLSTIAQGYMTGATEQAEIDALLQIVETVISSGSKSALPAVTYPSITWVASGIQTDAQATIDDTTVVPAVLQYITDTYSGFVYDHSKCSRDIGYIIDGLRYDAMFGSKFRSIKSGMAYRRGLTSAGVVLDDQLEATLDAIDHLRREVREITTGTSTIKERTATIKDIIINNTVPGSFTITDPAGYDTGFYNARRLIVANKAFLQDEVEAYMNTNYNSIWVGLSAGDQAKCLRDMGYIVDALQYDLTYRGNLETIVAARAYYVDGVFQEPSDQKTAALAVQDRLAAIIDDVATGVAITPSAGNVTSQDTSGTAGSAGAAAFAVDRINEIRNTIDTGLNPALISPSITWVDSSLQELKAVIDARRSIIQAAAIDYINHVHPTLSYDQDKCSRDVGYMIDAIAYDLIFGSDFRSSKAGMSYRRGLTSTDVVLTDQLGPTIDTVEFIEDALTELTIGVDVTIGNANAATEAFKLVKGMANIVQNGLLSLSPVKLPSPTGYNTDALTDTAYATASNTAGSSATYGNAAAQLVANKAFIQQEVRKWLEDSGNGYDTFWATLSSGAQDRCIRDVGYIIDALRYDLTYGGNTQSVVAGNAYYSNFVLTIGADELPATLAAYARMRTVIGEVIAETTVTTSPGVTEVQDTSGTPGNAASIEFAEDRVDDILDHINNALPNATIEVANSWQLKEFTTAYERIVDRKDEIVEDVVYWVEKNHQDLVYNQDLCRRDAGLMVDAIARDVYTGSNFATVKAAMSYYRAIPSTQEVINNELMATVGAINFLAEKVHRIALTAPNTAVAHLIDNITGYISGGARPKTPKWIDASTSDSLDVAGASLIWENKEFIQEDVIAYIEENFPNIEYSQAACKRDVGYIIDALRYDLTYNSEYASYKMVEYYYLNTQLQIDSNDKDATLAAYDHMKFLTTDLSQNTLGSPGAAQTKVAPVFRDELQDVGDANTASRVEALMNIIYNGINENGVATATINLSDSTSNVITSTAPHNLTIGNEIISTGTFSDLPSGTLYVKSTPSTTTFTVASYFGGPELSIGDVSGLDEPIGVLRTADVTGVSATLRQQFTNIQGSKAAMQTAITEYIAEKFPTLVYDEAKCERDVGLIIDAVGRDMLSDTNFLTTIAALSYYRGAQADLVIRSQRIATVQSFRELKNLMTSYVTGEGSGYGGNHGRANAKTRINNLMDIVINVVDKGENITPEFQGTVTYFNDRETINAVDILKANSDFLGEEATAWIKASYGGTVTSISGTPSLFQFSADHNLAVDDPIVFDTSLGGVVAGTTYYVAAIDANDTMQISATKGGDALELAGGAGSTVVSYAFDETACKRDMAAYIEAMVYDLQYPGNYHSLRAARLYVNAVDGSQYSDMFYVRDATGCRNMTLNGLRGNLTELNEFSTRRPTGGAYVSLDPGFGPNDSEAWINTKSPYTQNVTTFGVGCVGGKIDGSIHAGGNRSMVANDFTQVLSDGIGVWCTGNNSLTELVSVFAYYNYSGYIADLGGRIRATNGNSSYGTYGVIAEGTDTGEEPIVATVDNLSQDALVYGVLTDGEENVLAMEYSNAGTGYTNVEYAISGAGFNAATIGDEFRDQGVVETRIIDLDDGTTVGGEDYVIAQNVAQGGDTVTVQIAATDFALSNAYNGMRVQLTAGTGVGQYATILSYNNGSKVAKVYKQHAGPFTITDTNATGNVVTVTGPYEQLYVNMPVYVGGDVGGLTENDLYYIITNNNDGTFVLSDSEGGSAVTLTTTTGQSVAMYAAGWDNVIPAKPAEAALDLTTGYTIEPAFLYSEPGFSSSATTTNDAVSFGAVNYANDRFIAIQTGGTATNYSLDGTTWAAGGAMPASANWTSVAYGGGQGATATAVIGGLGGSGAVLEAELGELNSIGLPGPTQIKQVNVINGGTGYVTPPTIVFTATSGGGGATAVATVKDGSIQNIIITSTGAGYGAAPTVTAETDKLTEIIVDTKGRGYLNAPTVTLSGGGASTQASVSATLDNTGVATITIDLDGNDDPLFGEGYTSVPTVEILDAGAKWVAIANGSTNNANLPTSAAADGTWSAGTALPASNYADIAYGNGVFVVVGGAGGSGGAATSTDGSSWVSRTITTPATGSFTSVAYGGTKYVAINSDGYTAYSSNGIVWTAGSNMPSAVGNWTSVAYGNGRFAAISDVGEYAVSYDFGANWITEGNTLNNILATGWTTIAYGQGVFLATANSTTLCATSPDGILWTERTIGTSGSYIATFGNPNNVPTWTAVTNAANNNGVTIKTGARTLGRCYAEDGTINTTTLLEPGSGYPIGNIVSVTAPNTIELDSTDNMFVGQPITFDGTDLNTIGLDSETLYYVSDISGTDIEVSLISGGASYDVESIVAEDVTSASFQAGPEVTITDPSSTVDAKVNPRIRNGCLANPTFTNRGTGYTTATAELGGDGTADLYQPSTFIAVEGLFELPEPGSNVEFGNIPATWYKLVTISNVQGQEGAYTATFQISPGLRVLNAPKHGTSVTTTNKYSQVRLTGHDFLYIGTGNQAQTNYPYVDITTADINAQYLSSGGGRVFFTSTDQDGNFNVGDLFGVQQSTGTATLDADAFNLAGLQSLQINGLGLGIGSAIITQFSTDPFFTENSDNIVPTQRAIKSYITAQIGGGQSSLNVNTLTAGTVFIANDEITTTSGGQLNIKAKMNFTGGVDGAPVALGYFLAR